MKKILNRHNSIKGKPTFSQKLLDNDHYELYSGSSAPQPNRPTGSNPSYTGVNPINGGSSNSASTIHSHDTKEASTRGSDGYDWEFCIVVPNAEFYAKKREEERANAIRSGKSILTISKSTGNANRLPFEEIIERLQLAGLEVYCFSSGDGDEIYIKVRAPLHRLKEHATEFGFEMLYDSKHLQTVVDKKNKPISDDPDVTSLTPYQFIYGPYDQEKPELFARAAGLDHPFSPTIRIKLLMDIITNNEENCCALNLRKLKGDGGDDENSSIIAYFPIHDPSARDRLWRIWSNLGWRPWLQPSDEIKEYLGEKVALYFEFTAHYTTWLISLSIGGIVVAFDMAIETGTTGSFNDALLTGYTIPFYCIFVSFWSQLMIEFWKRHEARKAMEWGQSSFEDSQTERPEFQGESSRSVINGDDVKFFPSDKKRSKLFYSYFIVGCMMLLVVACVSGIFGLQYYINSDVNDDSNKSSGNTAVSIFSAIQIVVLNMVYSDMAISLNDNENHRTDTEYDDSLIGKLFAFSFINSYASLFFIAFIKSNLGEACQGPCLAELAYQLTILLVSKMTIEKVTNYITIKVTQYMTDRAEKAEYAEAMRTGKEVFEPTKLEIEKRLEEYDQSLGVLQDYAQVFIQFGFVTLFVAACPVAPILAYVSNLIEIRSDGYKLLFFSRRTIPVGAQDIGTWLSILQMTAVIAVVTNAGLVCFTMELIDFSGVGHVWLFAGFQYAIFIAMAIFAFIVDDVPEEVQLQLDRQDYLRERAAMSREELEAERSNKASSKPVQKKVNRDALVIHDYDEGEPPKKVQLPSSYSSGCIIC